MVMAGHVDTQLNSCKEKIKVMCVKDLIKERYFNSHQQNSENYAKNKVYKNLLSLKFETGSYFP